MKIIFYDINNIIDLSLEIDGYEILRLETKNEISDILKNNPKEKYLILNASFLEDGIHDFFKQLKNEFPHILLSVVIFSKHKVKEVQEIFDLNIYEIYCGDYLNENSILNLVDCVNTPLEEAFFKKSIIVGQSDKTSSKIIDFELNLESKKNEDVSLKDSEISNKKISSKNQENEKTAFKKLETIIKKTIGFNKDNQEENDLIEKKNQEIEDMFSVAVLEEEMENDENKKGMDDSSDLFDSNPETETVQMRSNEEIENDSGVNLDLDDVGDLQLGNDDSDLNMDLNNADEGEFNLNINEEISDFDLQLGEASEVSDIELKDDLGGLDLPDNVGDLALGEQDLSIDSNQDLNLEGDVTFENNNEEIDFSLDDNKIDNEEENGIDFSASENISVEDEPNLELGALDLDDISPEATLDIENKVGDVPEDEDVFLGESDETGDIDVGLINSVPIEQNQMMGNTDEDLIGQEFDYKTGMIEQGAIAAVNGGPEEIVEETLEENLFSDHSEKIDADSDSEGFSIGSEVSRSAKFDGEELIQAKAMMETFKAQRDKLDNENADLKKLLFQMEKDKNTLKEELTEAKIEASIFKQKFEKINNAKSGNAETAMDQLRIVEAKNRALKSQIETLKTNFIIDKQKVSKREKDLESKIELMEIDIASQLKSREEKILELKRKIESLEFNMETTAIQNQGLRENKKVLSERLRLVSESIRGAGRVLDESIDFEEMFDTDNYEDKAS